MHSRSIPFLSILLTAFLLALLQVTAAAQGAMRSNGVDLAQPLTVRWRYASDLTLNLTPAFDEESIYVPLSGGNLVALKAATGQLRWRAEIGGELSASPVADRERIYVASEIGGANTSARPGAMGTLRSLGREGGVTQWMRTLAKPLKGALALVNGTLFGGGSDGKVYAFDPHTGEARWGFQYSAPFNAQPVVADSRVYLGSEDGALLALDENSGKLLWRYRSKGPIRGPVAVANGTVYFGSGDGYVYAVNARNGDLRWRTRTGAGVQAVVRVGDGLLVASLDNFAYLYSLSGTRLWKRQLPGRIASQPFTTNEGALFTPLSSSAAVVLGLHDGRPVNSLPTDEEMTTSASPISVGDAVFVTTQHGLLAFAQPKNGLTKSP
ncbi:MAG TPA: PQQ-binding-like beta-propeller repeat protein [Pyrinomonadaceae bacterium]|nr:PQQ-binding-like beta-propeller repeat protein [Pyrinomonadaceae bacterium]